MFKNREEAGKKLAERLQPYKTNLNTIVIGLPRGGVVVAFQVAHHLDLPLDIVAPRKISMPENPEAAIGAITSDGQQVLNKALIAEVGIEQDYIALAIAQAEQEAERRTQVYRAGRGPLSLKGKTVIVVDDGVATGATMEVAVKSIQSQGPKKVIVAIPVAPQTFLRHIAKQVDEIVCLESPPSFFAVGQVYHAFSQTEDDEVIALLEKNRLTSR